MKLYCLQKNRTQKLVNRFICAFVFLLSVAFLNVSDGWAQSLIVNEIMTSNTQILDEDGDSSDWIEIYNNSGAALNIGGYGLSDDANEPLKWTFPSYTMQAGEYLLVWASGKDKKIPLPYFHTSFGLSSNDDIVLIANSNGQTISSISFNNVPRNLSYGKNSLGELVYYKEDNRSPGAANETPLSSIVHYSLEGGFFSSGVSVALSTDLPGTQIRYTTNGRTPTASSTLYTSPISINQTATIRAISTRPGHEPSPQTGETYLINFNNQTLPVLAIAIEEEYLWDPDVGIFPGEGTTPGDTPNNQLQQSRELFASYFTVDGQKKFAQHLEIQVVGASSRDEWMRPFKLSAGIDPMKHMIEADIMANGHIEQRHFHVRNNNQDGIKLIDYSPLAKPSFGIRNALFSNLVRDNKNVELRDDNGSVLVLINGFNFGYMNLGQKRDNATIQEMHPNVDDDDVDMVVLRNNDFEEAFLAPDNQVVIMDFFGIGYAEYEEVSQSAVLEAGSNQPTKGIEDFFTLVNFMQSNNLAIPANYNWVKERLDIPSFIAGSVARIIAGDLDAATNNTAFWRNAPVGQEPGPFFHYLFDFDATFGITNAALHQDTLSIMVMNSKMLGPLLQNSEFKNAFINAFDQFLNGTFASSNTLPLATDLEAKIQPWIQNQIDLWGTGLYSYSQWQNNMNHLKNYLTIRPAEMRTFVKNYFSLPGASVPISWNISPNEGGEILIDNAIIDYPAPTLGNYFRSPMTIRAKNTPGYGFDHFEINGNIINDLTYTFTPSSSTTVIAYFTEDPTAPAADLVVNEVVTGGALKITDEDGDSQDWIEIYNTTDNAIDLTGKYLTDDPDELTKWAFPNVSIAAGDFMVIYASGKDRTDQTSNLHTNFGLSSSGDPVLLVEEDGETIINQFTQSESANIPSDHSGGRIPDGSIVLGYFSVGTPGAPNYDPGAPASITSPVSGDTIFNPQTFEWTQGSQVAEYKLNIGRNFSVFNNTFADDFLFEYQGTDLSVLATSIPQDGAPVFAKLWSKINGEWVGSNVETYFTAAASSGPAGDDEGDGEESLFIGTSVYEAPKDPTVDIEDPIIYGEDEDTFETQTMEADKPNVRLEQDKQMSTRVKRRLSFATKN